MVLVWCNWKNVSVANIQIVHFAIFHSTLLELGASPNYKDSRGLTPLYLSVTKKTDSKICESLLHDHGTLGIQDTQGWQEVHQVRSGHRLEGSDYKYCYIVGARAHIAGVFWVYIIGTLHYVLVDSLLELIV